MAKRWWKSITVPIYRTPITFVALMDGDEQKRVWLEKRDVIVPDTWGAGVFTKPSGEIFFVIGDQSQYSTNTIVHESVHAAWRTIDLIGAEVDSANHEQLAYLAGYIGNEAVKFFSKVYDNE